MCFKDQSYETNNGWWGCLLRKILAKVQEDLLAQETIMGKKKPSTKTVLLRQKINELHNIMWKQKYLLCRQRARAAFSAPQLVLPKQEGRADPCCVSIQDCCSLANNAPSWYDTAQPDVMDTKHISSLPCLWKQKLATYSDGQSFGDIRISEERFWPSPSKTSRSLILNYKGIVWHHFSSIPNYKIKLDYSGYNSYLCIFHIVSFAAPLYGLESQVGKQRRKHC